MTSDGGGSPRSSKDQAGVSTSDRPDAGRGDKSEKPKTVDVEEIGGPKGPEPTRYGDWEKGGRCSDF